MVPTLASVTREPIRGKHRVRHNTFHGFDAEAEADADADADN